MDVLIVRDQHHARVNFVSFKAHLWVVLNMELDVFNCNFVKIDHRDVEDMIKLLREDGLIVDAA